MVDQEMIERVAAAIDSADVGFKMSLTRLVDGEHTYELRMDGKVEEFDNTDDAYIRIREIKQRKQAEAVIAAIATEGVSDDNLAYNIGLEIRYAIAASGVDPIQHIPEVDEIIKRRIAEIRALANSPDATPDTAGIRDESWGASDH